MNSNLTLWDPDVNVHIQKSVETNRVSVSFGNWPQPHITMFMSEEDLATLTQNLLDAKWQFMAGVNHG